jgi:hypothetical protein
VVDVKDVVETAEDVDSVVDVVGLVDVLVLDDFFVLPQLHPRFSKAVDAGFNVDAALAEAPVTLAVATLVTSAEIEAAIDAESTLNVLVAFDTAAIGGPVAEGDGALSTAAKSNCCGAGAAATICARAAAMAMLDHIL